MAETNEKEDFEIEGFPSIDAALIFSGWIAKNKPTPQIFH